MNNLDFSTQLIQLGNGNPSLNANNAAKTNGGLKGINAMAFMDMLLGKIQVEEAPAPQNTKIKIIADENLNLEQDDIDGLLHEQGDMNLIKLALLGQEAGVDIEEMLAKLKIEKMDNRVEQLTKLIDHLTNGLPVKVNNAESIEALVARLQERIENLETKISALRALSDNEDDISDNFSLLIATGLNPAQITNIGKRIEHVENKLGRELTVDDLIAGVGNIIPAPGSDDELSAADLLELAEHTVLTDELAEKMNAMNVGGTDSAAMMGMNGEAATAQEKNGALPDEVNVQTLRTNAELQELRNTIKNNKTGLIKANLEKLPDIANPLAGGFTGDIMLPENWMSFFAAAFEALGIDIDSGLPYSPSMQAIHATTAIQQAGQPHAATQMVATQMAKSAQSGMASEMTIQLDPPELGRVDVKLEFGKDNAIKASLIVEKPETYLLLQRDAAALERALQNAGLDTDSSSLNFELANDSYAFDGDGDRNGSGESGNHMGARKDKNEQEIIETTMTWNFDPETGHTHYSIIA